MKETSANTSTLHPFSSGLPIQMLIVIQNGRVRARASILTCANQIGRDGVSTTFFSPPKTSLFNPITWVIGNYCLNCFTADYSRRPSTCSETEWAHLSAPLWRRPVQSRATQHADRPLFYSFSNHLFSLSLSLTLTFHHSNDKYQQVK